MNEQKEKIISDIRSLLERYERGELGGEYMPEDARPSCIALDSEDNFLFLTLPMALNYQRDSYKLWEYASACFLDSSTNWVFYPLKVISSSEEMLRESLLKHKVALQPNKHISTWFRLCDSLCELSEGSVRKLLETNNHDVELLKVFMQSTYKKRFPYLSGHKIFNYWLYVLSNYTSIKLMNKDLITIAPDTHIIQATIKLGLLSNDFEYLSVNRALVSEAWKDLLEKTGIEPIDVHTPLWLWSKSNFK